MHPIPQTIETVRELQRYEPDLGLLEHLQETADLVEQIVPTVIGLSVTWVDQALTFTLVSSTEEIAALDAVQYPAGGPSVDSVASGQSLSVDAQDLMNESAWRLLAQTTAAVSVRSTLTLLFTRGGTTTGSVNLYGATDHAFERHHDELARLLGAHVSDVVRNADLSFSTRQAAEQSPAILREENTVDIAIGIVAAALNLDVRDAATQVHHAAQRAGITVQQFSRALTGLYG